MSIQFNDLRYLFPTPCQECSAHAKHNMYHPDEKPKSITRLEGYLRAGGTQYYLKDFTNQAFPSEEQGKMKKLVDKAFKNVEYSFSDVKYLFPWNDGFDFGCAPSVNIAGQNVDCVNKLKKYITNTGCELARTRLDEYLIFAPSEERKRLIDQAIIELSGDL